MSHIVYRGVVVEEIMSIMNVTMVTPLMKHHYLKPYSKPGPAKASVTILRKRLGKSFKDGYVEVSKEWERLD